jgi:diguanylate cyclase (GGDEF)-like protein
MYTLLQAVFLFYQSCGFVPVIATAPMVKNLLERWFYLMNDFAVQYNFITFGAVETQNTDLALFRVRSSDEILPIMRNVDMYGVLINSTIINISGILKALKADIRTAPLPVIAIGTDDKIYIDMGFDETCLNVDDLCIQRIVSLREARKTLFEQANKDALTGCYNRNALKTYGGTDGKEFSVIMCDLDLFKQVNDTYGHDAGDVVLQSFAKYLQAKSRNSDMAVRMGGEEFLILLPGTTQDQVLVVAEKLHAGWPGQVETTWKTIPVTFSAGVATGTEPAQVQKQADQALYSAKGSGRNRVMVYSSGMSNQIEGIAPPPSVPPWLKKKKPEPKPEPAPVQNREPAGYGKAIVSILIAIGRAISTIAMLPIRIVDGILSLAHSIYTWIIVLSVYAAVIYIAYQTHHAFYIMLDGYRIPLPFASSFWRYMGKWHIY